MCCVRGVCRSYLQPKNLWEGAGLLANCSCVCNEATLYRGCSHPMIQHERDNNAGLFQPEQDQNAQVVT